MLVSNGRPILLCLEMSSLYTCHDLELIACPRRQAYLEAAALHLWRSTSNPSGVESITGVWVSSDDSSVLPEAQELAPVYFPNVQKDKVITISFRDTGPEHPNTTPDELSTKAHEMVSKRCPT